LLKGDLDVGLRPQVVDLIRLDFLQDTPEPRAVRQVSIVKEEARVRLMRIPIQVVYTARVEDAGAADYAVDLVPFGEKKLGEIAPILSCNAGYQRFFHANLRIPVS
jgi:hypothetical protein